MLLTKDRVASIWAEGGLAHLLFRFVQKLLEPVVVFGSVIFITRDLNRPLPEPRTGSDFKLREASKADIGLLLKASDPSRTPAELLKRFEHGHSCFIAAYRNGSVAHTRWCATEAARIPELGAEVLLGRKETYMYDSYTSSRMRNMGIDGAVSDFAARVLRDAGFERIYAYVRTDNPLGLKAVKQWYRRVGKLWYFHARGFRPLVWGKRGPEMPILTS